MATSLITALEFERRKKGLRQFDVSRKTGIFAGRLGDIEHGKLKPTEKEIKLIAKALDITPEVLTSLIAPRPEYITLFISRDGIQGASVHYIQGDETSTAEVYRLFEEVRPGLEKLNVKLGGKYPVRPLNIAPFRLETD